MGHGKTLPVATKSVTLCNMNPPHGRPWEGQYVRARTKVDMTHTQPFMLQTSPFGGDVSTLHPDQQNDGRHAHRMAMQHRAFPPGQQMGGLLLYYIGSTRNLMGHAGHHTGMVQAHPGILLSRVVRAHYPVHYQGRTKSDGSKEQQKRPRKDAPQDLHDGKVSGAQALHSRYVRARYRPSRSNREKSWSPVAH